MLVGLVENFYAWLSGGRIVDGTIPRIESGYYNYDICFENPRAYCKDLDPGHREMAATWFLSPNRLATETIAVTAAFTVILLLLVPSLTSPKATIKFSESISPPVTLRITSSLCLAAQVWYKITGYENKLAFMVMPCNVLWTCCFLTSLPVVHPTIRYCIVQCWYSFQILVWVVFAIADTGDLYMPFEIEYFWANHVLLLFIPFYFLLTSKVPAASGGIVDFLKWWLLSCSTTGIFYFAFATPLSILSRLNLNYMLSPPPVPPPGVSLTENFRIESMALMAVGFFISRLITVGVDLMKNLVVGKTKKA